MYVRVVIESECRTGGEGGRGEVRYCAIRAALLSVKLLMAVE